jgi:hypothetical protein
VPQIFTMGFMLAWAGQFGFWFALFWSCLPLAIAAYELNLLNQRFA